MALLYRFCKRIKRTLELGWQETKEKKVKSNATLGFKFVAERGLDHL
jgi:hypothetical protein